MNDEHQLVQVPEIVYGTFVGEINQLTCEKIIQNLIQGKQAGVKEIHLLFQSTGGYVSEGVCLFNFFRTFEMELILYNTGSIMSAGAVAFLGANSRKASKYSVFMLHWSTRASALLDANNIRATSESMIYDNQRIADIYTDRIHLTDDHHSRMKNADLTLTPAEALEVGIIHGIEEFAPPPGAHIFCI